MSLPVVFLHRGDHKYLKIAINRAKKSGNEVYLLGENSNKDFCNNWINMDTLQSDRIIAFKNAYVHMSTNPKEFELLCILRYFYLHEMMLQNNLSGIILADSDCLIYKKYEDEEYAPFDCAFGWDFDARPGYICPSSCYWTLQALEHFTSFCLDAYTNNLDILKEKWAAYKGKQGGISDLTLLHMWYLSTPPLQILNLMEDKSAIFEYVPAWDHDKKHLYQHNEFTKLLKIKFIDNKPYFIRMDGSLQSVNNLHMHGGKKIYMGLFDKYKENGISFYLLECYRRLKWRIVRTVYKARKK